MKYIIYFLMISLSISFSQSIAWSNTISLNTEDNGIVQIDTDDDGNIYVAGWYGAPNYANWDYSTFDSLISSPDISLLKLSSNGELVFEQDYGKLFHNLKGMVSCYEGIKLIGNTDSGYNPLSYRYFSIGTCNEEGALIDTTFFIPWYIYGESSFINFILPTKDNGYIYSYFDGGSGALSRISPVDSLCKSFPFDSANFPPDSLYTTGNHGLNARSVDVTKDNGVIMTGEIESYLFISKLDTIKSYSFIIKLNESFDVDWQLYYPYIYDNYPDEIAYTYTSIETLTDSTYLTTCWVDENDNEDVDAGENYLLIINGQGDVSWVYNSFDEAIKVEEMSHKDFIVRGIDTNTLWKFRYNGTGMDMLWSQVYPDLDIYKVMPDGFINAKIVNDELYIYKVLDDTGIDNQVALPKTSQLYSNYPNPFNPITTLSYSLSEKGQIQLIIYNTKGEVVSELVNREQNTGLYNIKFDGNSLNSGVYFYQLKLNNISVDAKRMLLIK